jgi:hypothetical protein
VNSKNESKSLRQKEAKKKSRKKLSQLAGGSKAEISENG